MDPTNAKVESIIRDGLREAHGYDPDASRLDADGDDVDEPCLDCGHGLGAHHGPRGEQRCGEDGCDCRLPRYASRSHYSADDDLVGTPDHNRKV